MEAIGNPKGETTIGRAKVRFEERIVVVGSGTRLERFAAPWRGVGELRQADTEDKVQYAQYTHEGWRVSALISISFMVTRGRLLPSRRILYR